MGELFLLSGGGLYPAHTHARALQRNQKYTCFRTVDARLLLAAPGKKNSLILPALILCEHVRGLQIPQKIDIFRSAYVPQVLTGIIGAPGGCIFWQRNPGRAVSNPRRYHAARKDKHGILYTVSGGHRLRAPRPLVRHVAYTLHPRQDARPRDCRR